MPTQLLNRLYGRLDAATRSPLQQAILLAEQKGLLLYAVGGAVRDLLVGSNRIDLDLVVEGDAIALAGVLAQHLNVPVTSHPRFGTATIKAGGYRLDLAQARSELYERTGALPIVRPASLPDDLARRDFTINAMAVALTGARAGELIDFHRGAADVKAGLIRVLHDRSFQDDPTRMLRAVRYAARLAFSIEARTRQLLKRDLPGLKGVSGARLRHEFERLAHEPAAAAAIAQAQDLGVLRGIQKHLCVSVRQLNSLTELLGAIPPARREAVFFALLLTWQSEKQTEALISRLALTGRQAAAVRALGALKQKEAALGPKGLKVSEVVSLLSGTPLEAIEALALLTGNPAVRERLRRYLNEWRFVRPRLNGRDIEALGVPHGAEVGAALGALRVARLDGVVSRREDEAVLVRKLYGRGKSFEGRHG